jgi:hypothetical protein
VTEGDAVGVPPTPGGAPTAPGRPDFSSRLFLLLALGLLGVGLAFWRPIPVGVWHDDGVYMMVGRALAHGQGLHYAGVPGDPPAAKFPPAYPAFLALLWLLLGSVGAVTLAAELLNLVFLAGAGGLLGWAVYRNTALSRRASLGVAALAFISADVWRWALVPLSEPLFILISAGALVAWKGAARAGDRRAAALLSALLVAAVLTRSAGAALVAGFALALLLRRGWRVALAVAAPPALAALAWGAWGASRAALIPEGMRDILGPYGGWLTGQIFGAPAAFLAGLPMHAALVGERVCALLLPGVSGPLFWVAAIPLVAFAVWGWVRLLRAFPPLAWGMLAYLAMVILWPFVDRRLLAPLHPWMVVAVCVGLADALGRAPGARIRQALAGAAFVWVAAFAAVTASRASREWAVEAYQLRARRMAAAVEVLRRTAPDTTVVGAPEFWAALNLHGGWRVVPSALFIPRAEEVGEPVWGTPEEQLSLWWNAGVDQVLLENGRTVHGATLDLLDARCPGTVQVLAEMPPQILVALHWTAACGEALGLPPR